MRCGLIKGSPLTRMWFALQVCQAEASREGRHLEVNYELATQLMLRRHCAGTEPAFPGTGN